MAQLEEMIEQLRLLYREVNHDHQWRKVDELHKVQAELERAGCTIDHAYGVYLHTPDGKTITLDEWNDEQNGTEVPLDK